MLDVYIYCLVLSLIFKFVLFKKMKKKKKKEKNYWFLLLLLTMRVYMCTKKVKMKRC